MATESSISSIEELYSTVKAPFAMYQIRKLMSNTQQKIYEAVDDLAINPRPQNIQLMETMGSGEYPQFSLNVIGDWNLIYQVDEEKQRVLINAIARF